MSVLSAKTQIQASPEQVFNVISDPETAMRLIPGGLRVIDVPKLPLSRGTVLGWEFQLLGMPLRGRWVVDEITPPFFYVARTVGGVDGRLTYTIIPRGSGCRLSFSFDYQLPSSLIQKYTLKFVEPHAQNIIDTYLTSIKNFVELAAPKKSS